MEYDGDARVSVCARAVTFAKKNVVIVRQPTEVTMTWTTHKVVNQVPVLTDVNLYDTDLALQESVCTLSDSIHNDELLRYGQILGTEHVRHQAELANRYPPVPCLWDAQ